MYRSEQQLSFYDADFRPEVALARKPRGIEGSCDVKDLKLHLKAQVPSFGPEDIVLVAGDQESAAETGVSHRVHLLGLAAKEDRAVDAEILGRVEVTGGDKKMILSRELPVHLSSNRN